MADEPHAPALGEIKVEPFEDRGPGRVREVQVADSKVTPGSLAELIALVDKGTVSASAARPNASHAASRFTHKITKSSA